MKSAHHFTLVRDTRPNNHVWCMLDDVYWSSTLAQLRNGQISVGQNDAGINFTAEFRVEGDRIRATLTPSSSGYRYTHLRVWRWYALKPKMQGEDKVD